MGITKAKKVIELSRDNRKILVTLYEGNQVSSCVEEAKKKYCETCQCDDATCQEWIEHLKGKGYQATEVELGELGIEESLPKFMEGRERAVKPKVAVVVESETAIAIKPEITVEEGKSAISETDQNLP